MPITSLPRDLCLTYVNTLTWRGAEEPAETLHGLGDLLGWLMRSAGVGAADLQGARDWARLHPVRSAHVFRGALALREALYRIFSALAANKAARRVDLAILQRALAAAPARRALASTKGGYGWQLGPARPTARWLLAPVLWSAADLLVDEARHRVRQCANDRCLWLFIDQSRKATRRWCDMASCGNRAKAGRHYLKTKRGR